MPDPYYQETQEGYRVSKTFDGARWVYMAWSPPDLPGLSHWQWHARRCNTATRPLGSPTPRRREILGVYATAEEARARCEAEEV